MRRHPPDLPEIQSPPPKIELERNPRILSNSLCRPILRWPSDRSKATGHAFSAPRRIFLHIGDSGAERSHFELPGDFCSSPGTDGVGTQRNNEKTDRALSGAVSDLMVVQLLFCGCALPARRRSVAFAETLATPPIASLDEARSQIIASTVAAHELLRFGLTLGLLQWRSCRPGVYRLSLLSIGRFRAFHSLGLLQPYRLVTDGCSVGPPKRAINAHFSSDQPGNRRRWEGEWSVNTLSGFASEPERCV